MKTFKNVLRYIGLAFYLLIAAIFAFIEIRSLFAGDFSLMNNQAVAFFSILFRGLYFLAMLVFGVIMIVFMVKKEKISPVLLAMNIALIIGALFSLLYFHLIVAIVLALFNLIGFAVILSLSLRKPEN